MRGGRLNTIVSIQSPTMTQLSSGEPVLTWTTTILRRRAERKDVRGSERDTPAAKVAYEQVTFRVRASDDVADVTPNYRIIYPALTQLEENDVSFSVEHRRIYDVLAVSEFDDGAGFEFLTQRRSDVTT